MSATYITIATGLGLVAFGAFFAGTHFYNSGEAQREGDDSCYFTESCPVLNVTLFSRQ